MSGESRRLGEDFFASPTQQVALALLGKVLVKALPDGQRVSGFIVEVEAYLAEQDAASHSARGPTRRNASMFASPGTLYVYSIHAKHCLNVVTEREGEGAAVLIRALEPWEGLQTMLEQRGFSKQPALDMPRLELKTAIGLTSGPGRLCQALAIDRRHDGLDLSTSHEVWLESHESVRQDWSPRCTPRIGISQSQELQLRWFIDGHRFVSGRVRDHSQRSRWSFHSD